MKKIEVVAGIIYNNKGEVLCTQRNISPLSYISKKYEFPGGKIESKETHHEALQREIFEELNINIDISNLFLTVEHSYPDFFLTMHSYNCKANSTLIKMNEHISYKWLNINNLKILDWAAADKPIVEKLTSQS
jgi:8-oxo-dGTP diphosphatase